MFQNWPDPLIIWSDNCCADEPELHVVFPLTRVRHFRISQSAILLQVKLDVLHVHFRYQAVVKKSHPLFKAFDRELSEAFFGPESTRTAETRIPPPADLEAKLNTWFQKYRTVGAPLSAW